jgi:D-inositol-3-phosphate glycosyltransferase
VLLFVGRIQPLKGLDVAVEALARIERQDARLVTVGGPSGRDGEAEVARVQALARDLGVADRIDWIDPQPHHLLSTWYRTADVCLVPSRSESFGLVALEAAACGVPVVASAVGGLRTIVDHGRTGFLVDDREPARFADYVDRLLADPDLADALAREAAVVARGYTWSTTAARLRRLYADLAAREPVSC